jgi:hypothetical protein
MAGAALAGSLVLVLLSIRLIGSKVRDDTRREYESLVAQAKQAEATGAFGDALRDAIAAIELAETRKGAGDLDAIRQWRDHLSQREVAQRLDGLETLDPESAFGEALILAERVKSDEALAGLRETVLEALTRERLRDASRRLAAAESVFGGSRYADALQHCVHLLAMPGITSDKNASSLLEQVHEMIRNVAERAGVQVVPVQGTFHLGSASSFHRSVVTPIVESLRSRGYVIPEDAGPLGPDWKGHTGYLLRVAIAESQDGHYLQSPNQMTRIDAKVELKHHDASFWYTSVNGRTRVPPRNMNAFEAGHVATAKTRGTAAERRLFEDAVDALMERMGGKLAGVPVPAR